MSLNLASARLGLLEVVGLAQMLIIELVLERGVSCLGEHALLFQDGEDAHGLEDITTRGRKRLERRKIGKLPESEEKVVPMHFTTLS